MNDAIATDAAARREFEAWLAGFELRYAALLADLAHAKLLADSAAGLVLGAHISQEEFPELAGEAMADGLIEVGSGLDCAVDEFPSTIRFIEASARSLATQFDTATKVTSVVAGD